MSAKGYSSRETWLKALSRSKRQKLPFRLRSRLRTRARSRKKARFIGQYKDLLYLYARYHPLENAMSLKTFIHTVTFACENFVILVDWYTEDSRNALILARNNQSSAQRQLAVGEQITIPSSLMRNLRPFPEAAVPQGAGGGSGEELVNAA